MQKRHILLFSKLHAFVAGSDIFSWQERVTSHRVIGSFKPLFIWHSLIYSVIIACNNKHSILVSIYRCILSITCRLIRFVWLEFNNVLYRALTIIKYHLLKTRDLLVTLINLTTIAIILIKSNSKYLDN